MLLHYIPLCFLAQSTDEVIIYWDSVRKGLYFADKEYMLDNALITSLDLHINNNSVDVTTNTDHENCKILIQYIAKTVPDLVGVSTWSERFPLFGSKSA